MRVRITSDGTIRGTHVFDAETGKEIKDVISLSFFCSADSMATTIELLPDSADITSEAEIGTNEIAEGD
jgi:hypothetical protein